MVDDAAPRIDCPECAAIDWTDGAFAFRSDGVRTDLQRVSGTTPTGAGWRCALCGHVLDDAAFSQALNRLEDAGSA